MKKVSTKYHVEVSPDQGERWFRDFNPSLSLADAKRRIRESKMNEGEKIYSRVGTVLVECGENPKADYRIVKVERTIVG